VGFGAVEVKSGGHFGSSICLHMAGVVLGRGLAKDKAKGWVREWTMELVVPTE